MSKTARTRLAERCTTSLGETGDLGDVAARRVEGSSDSLSQTVSMVNKARYQCRMRRAMALQRDGGTYVASSCFCALGLRPGVFLAGVISTLASRLTGDPPRGGADRRL